ncbi:MAG: FAD-dependent oxidoreductase, partial [bacterium]
MATAAPVTPPLLDALPMQVDVAIVGGGYTGMAAARAIALRRASVLVLERETLGWGASSRNGGFVLPGYKVDVDVLARRHGVERARQLWSFSLEALGFV